jgi:hypothetical protein
MTHTEFDIITQQVTMLGQLAGNLDLDAYLDAFNYSDAMLPLVDPTAYRRAHSVGGHEAAHDLKEIARAVKALGDAHRRAVAHREARVEKYGIERIREVREDLGHSIDALRRDAAAQQEGSEA